MTCMNLKSRRSTAAAVAVLLLFPAAWADDAPTVEASNARVTAVLGAQSVNDIAARGRARFNEFREVPEGAVFEFGRLTWAPKEGTTTLSFTAVDVLEDDQRYLFELTNPARVAFRAAYSELPRFYSSGSTTIWSGAGSGELTLANAFRQGAETAAGLPTAPFAAPALVAYMRAALAGAAPFDLATQRKDLSGALEVRVARDVTLGLTGRRERREGTRPLGFGTYIRRQALSGVPGTGAGSFWRETIEARGSELIEPLDYTTTEAAVTLSWARAGHSLSAGWFGSRFRNDTDALFFDNPFEAAPGRASAGVFDPRSDQEPAAPNGNNNLRGLFARSSVQLWPQNDYNRVFGQASLRLGSNTRLTASVARGTLKQDAPFLPYAENDQVVFAGVAGQPGVVYARDAALPRASLGGEMITTQADLKLSVRPSPALTLRAAYRHYDLDDRRPQIVFPGYSSSGDAYFRASIGQTSPSGARTLFNTIGGYTRGRLNVGAAYRLGRFTLDGEYARTAWDYEARQVERTLDDSFKGTLRLALGQASVNAFYLHASRDFEDRYAVGLETSGVRAFDVWTRERDQFGADVDLPLDERITLAFGGSAWKDEYPGAVPGFAYGYGLQESRSGSLYAGLNYTAGDWQAGAWAGLDEYEWNSLQVTKTSRSADYNPINRWERGSSDDVYWVGFEVVGPLGKKGRAQANLDYQKFSGDWTTQNLGTPDVGSAVAYPYPELSDSTLTARLSLSWRLDARVSIEGRYLYEPYRLDDFTWDLWQPYMQGVLRETRASAGDLGDMNVSRFLFLDSRYGGYTAHVVSAFVHVTF